MCTIDLPKSTLLAIFRTSTKEVEVCHIYALIIPKHIDNLLRAFPKLHQILYCCCSVFDQLKSQQKVTELAQ